MSALDRLRAAGITVLDDAEWRPKVRARSQALAVVTAYPAPGGYRVSIWAEDQEHVVQAILDRLARLLDHGPEPDGWSWTSFGAWQLSLRAATDQESSALAEVDAALEL